jgi:NAD(P)-dependent dehydrogenase (short-subunit alcohol dehydrogenase family)
MNPTVLITGASTGLGRTAAGLFARSGWNVAATMRRAEDGAALAALPNVLVTRLDVQDPQSIGSAIEAALARFGRIDALVNNAGYGLFGIFEGTPPEKVREQFDVNVFGLMDTIRAILPHFRANKRGLTITVSSGAGVFTLPMLSLYCASKFALEGFSESLSYELSSQNITVKVVEPGGVVTTNFGKRSGAEAAANQPLADYDRFVAGANEIFAGLRASRKATEEDVARVILEAATDGSDRLRYVATADILPLVTARRETSEVDYMALMRATFLPKAK